MVSSSVSTGVVPLVGLGAFPLGVVVDGDSVVSSGTGSEPMMVRPSVQRAPGSVEGVVVATFVSVARGLVVLVVGVLVAIGVAGVVV